MSDPKDAGLVMRILRALRKAASGRARGEGLTVRPKDVSLSAYIYGMHDRCPPALFRPGQGGWVVISEAIGHDPHDRRGASYQNLVDAGLTVIVRLNNGYYPDGTIPAPEHYNDFARRCANFVAGSSGCWHWIIGNEPNHSQERPSGQEIQAADYARCYSLCRSAIRSMAGHQAILAAVAPWNVESGDWLQYLADVQQHALGLGGVDAMALHTYTHGSDPDLVFSDEKMASHPDRYYHFRAYRDFMDRIHPDLRGMPVYLTETDQDGPWADANSGWVQNAYTEIHNWNRSHAQRIRCLCLYHWARYDAYYIEGKGGVLADWDAAQQMGYKWTQPDEEDGMVQVDLPLINPGFEGGFREVDGDGNLKVAVGWQPWWHTTDARPEYKPAEYHVDPRRIRSGQFAQQWFNRWQTHTAGIYQQVENVPVGKPLVFEACVQAWSTNTEDPNVSDGRYRMRIGVDPYGGSDPESRDIVWSDAEPLAPMNPNEYVALKVETTSRSDRCTAFVWGQAEWRLSHNDAYVDDCRLYYLDEEQPPQPPPGQGWTEEQIRAIAREEIARAVDEWLAVLSSST